MMRQVAVDLLGLFPPLGEGCVGGIQASGRLAWDALRRHGGRSAHLFVCGGSIEPGAADRRSAIRRGGTRLGAVARASRTRWSAGTVLVWHVGLLKLLPFFRLSRARVVVFLHGVEAWRPLDWLTRRLLRRVDLFLTNSDHTWGRFLERHPALGRPAHATVHLGVGEPLPGPTPPPAPAPAALMLARLARGEAYKGHREVIAAWPEVRRRVPGAELWLAGDGDLRRELETWVGGLPQAAHVRFLGRVSEAEKERLLARCRCLALPSRGEGFGLVYAEAMRMGRPCLVSTADAGREVVGPPGCGLAVDPRSPAEVAAALGRLLTAGPEWDRWSRQARARYEARFTAAHFQARLLEAMSRAGAPVEASLA
jgi:phosphatidylinositol alpha-1,6-mannosyltransferase